MLGWCAEPTVRLANAGVGADDCTYGCMGFRGTTCNCQTQEPCADTVIPV